MIGSRETTTRIGFYLVPQFTLLAFSSAIDVLRMANQLSGQTLYRWTLSSSDGQPVTASIGIDMAVDHSAQTRERYDAVFVCGGPERASSAG